MARGQEINSAGSQFFICLGDAKHLDGNYTPFGEIIDGYEILDLISKVPTQYKQIMKQAVQKIPEDEDSNQWIQYDLNGKQYYFKVPLGIDSKTYYNDVKNKINNVSRPHVPIKIEKIRVINENDKK